MMQHQYRTLYFNNFAARPTPNQDCYCIDEAKPRPNFVLQDEYQVCRMDGARPRPQFVLQDQAGLGHAVAHV